MRKLIDLTGKRFGKLVVLSRGEDYVSPKDQIKPRWLCKCDCHNEDENPILIVGQDLRSGKVISCGCYKKERKKKSKLKYLIGERHKNENGRWYEIINFDETNNRRRKIIFDSGYEDNVLICQLNNGKVQDLCENNYYGVACLGVKNGTTYPLFWRWFNMIGRCYDIKHTAYQSYGAKGVVVEDYLLNFKNYCDVVSKLPNYKLLLQSPNDWQIDKDLLSGNIYARSTIMIIKTEHNLEIENSKKRICVAMCDMSNNLIDIFESISKAERVTGIHRGNIARCVRGDSRSAGGYIWRKV